MLDRGEHERRVDTRLAQAVELSLQIDSAFGRQAAETYLWNQLVPYHVSLRVLACAAFRRKPPAAQGEA